MNGINLEYLINQINSNNNNLFSTFQKLNRDGDPYYFVNMQNSSDGYVVNYRFLNRHGNKYNNKRCYLNELKFLVDSSINKKITRIDFNNICIKTCSSGTCGYAIMVRIIEKLNYGVYKGNGNVTLY